jgi:hypothetical protein
MTQVSIKELATEVTYSLNTDAARGEVAAHLMVPVLGKAACTKLIDRVMGLENVKDIRELRPFLQLT